MIKFLYILLLFGCLCPNAEAQIQQTGQKPNSVSSAATSVSSRVTNYDEKMKTIKSCPELNEQLSAMFGSNYTISDPKVVAQLEKNIADAKASTCIRKKSLYGIYGEEYVHYLHLINPSTQNKTK